MPEKKLSNRLDWGFLLLLSTAYFSSTINLQGILSLMPFIQRDFNISRAQVGLYSSAFFISATVAAIFTGQFVDKIGAKKGILIGVFSMGFFIILHGFASIYLFLLLLALVTGFGFSIISPSVNKAVIEGASSKDKGLSMGIMQMGGGIGSFIGASLLPIFAASFNWRLAVLIAGLNSIMIGIFVKIKLPDKLKRKTQDQGNQMGTIPKVKKMFNNKALVLICLLGFVFGLSVGSIPNHYNVYLTLDLNFTATRAGLMLGILQIGGLFGRIFWAWISDKFRYYERRWSFLLIVIMISIICSFYGFFLWRLADILWLIAPLSFLLGTVAMGWMGLFFTVVGERSDNKMTGIATGFSLIFIRVGILISPPIFGYIADIFNHYNYSWIALAVITLIGGSLFFLQEGKVSK